SSSSRPWSGRSRTCDGTSRDGCAPRHATRRSSSRRRPRSPAGTTSATGSGSAARSSAAGIRRAGSRGGRIRATGRPRRPRASATQPAALADAYLRIPFYAIGKAHYTLGGVVCYAILLAAGVERLGDHPVTRAVLYGALAAWGFTVCAAYFVVT